MTVYKKVMTRDAPLVVIEAWYEGFSGSIPKVFGFPWPRPIYRFHNGAVESWRASRAFLKELPLKVLAWLNKSEANRRKLLAAFENYLKLMSSLRAKKRPRIGRGRELATIIDVYRIFVDAMAGLIPGYWCVTWSDKMDFPREIVEKATALRNQDTLFDDTVSIIYSCLDRIAKRKHQPRELMKFVLLSELKKSLTNNQNLDFSIITARRNGYVYTERKLFLEREFKAAQKKYGYQLAEARVKPVKELKGTVANPGLARGRVKIVFNREQFAKVKMGDILVSPMTTPIYLPIMKKAAAFVTDEGGTACHAAIVAREMDKPCIVGTQIATKVFKDGDKIEVDAMKGVVRKIS